MIREQSSIFDCPTLQKQMGFFEELVLRSWQVMKQQLILIFGLVIIATVWYGPALAQKKDETPPPAFIDENGDGIDDRATFRHRQSQKMGGSTLLSVLSAQLTKAQRTALQAKINELLANGSTAHEIQKAVFAELENFGVDLTDTFLTRFKTVLTEEQMSELRKKVEGLKAEGATYREIQKAIHDELTQMGIAQGRRGPDRVGSLITEDQMSTLQKKIDGLVAEGASRRDIQKAINAELRSLGIDLPAQ